MKRMIKGLILPLLVFTGLHATETKSVHTTAKATTAHALQTDIKTQDVQIFTAPNAAGKITPKTIEKAFEKEGFFISENRDMNAPFVKTFKSTSFDTYNLFTVYRKDTVRNLVVQYPEIGLFTPMSMSIYSKKGSKDISLAFLSASASARMMHIPEDNPEIIALGQSIARAMHAALPQGKLQKTTYKMSKPKGDLIAKAVFDMKAGEDWEDAKDDFQMDFEGSLAPAGFILAGFTDLGYDFGEHNMTAYHFYDTYSICKLEVIYVVSQTHPEAGAFAPCSLYMYQKQGENKMYMAFPTVHKWIAALGIEDKASLDVLLDAQKKFEEILAKLTAKKK